MCMIQELEEKEYSEVVYYFVELQSREWAIVLVSRTSSLFIIIISKLLIEYKGSY